ncbi:MAG: Ppx/GppA phosphatase family protein [Alphaproteobacteria bacterium]|nr:Ppx/GppA phosphatase family protein [Alphaproteobacteria bacterium]
MMDGGVTEAERGARVPDAVSPASVASQAEDVGDSETRAVYAAIDLGTSSCRLLVARPHPPHRPAPPQSNFQVVASYARNVRLGEGVGENGALSDAAMARAMEALRHIDGKMRQNSVTRLRGVATAACRRASNSLDFLDTVRDAFGFKLDIIDPQEEARLALHGCLPLMDEGRPYGLVFDIGGGSTQIIWMKRNAEGGPGAGSGTKQPDVSVLATHSVPDGVVSLTERYGAKLADPHVYDRCVAELADSIGRFCKAHGVKEAVEAGQVQMIGASGTVTTLAGIEMGLRRYIRSEVDGATLSFQRVQRLTGFLRDLGRADLAAQPCIGEDRAELMRAGCAILDALCACWPVGRLRVADRGLREGILLDMMREDGVLPLGL